MIGNHVRSIHPRHKMTEKAFETLTKQHFGYNFEADNSYLTQTEFSYHLQKLQQTYAFKVIQSQNTNFTENLAQKSKNSIVFEENFNVLDQVYQYIKGYHYDGASFSEEDLVYGAAKGIAEATNDEYTVFFTPKNNKQFQEGLT